MLYGNVAYRVSDPYNLVMTMSSRKSFSEVLATSTRKLLFLKSTLHQELLLRSSSPRVSSSHRASRSTSPSTIPTTVSHGTSMSGPNARKRERSSASSSLTC